MNKKMENFNEIAEKIKDTLAAFGFRTSEIAAHPWDEVRIFAVMGCNSVRLWYRNGNTEYKIDGLLPFTANDRTAEFFRALGAVAAPQAANRLEELMASAIFRAREEGTTIAKVFLTRTV